MIPKGIVHIRGNIWTVTDWNRLTGLYSLSRSTNDLLVILEANRHLSDKIKFFTDFIEGNLDLDIIRMRRDFDLTYNVA